MAQGLLTGKYLQGIPTDSRAADPRSRFLNTGPVTAEKVEKVRKLDAIAQERGHSMAQMAHAWVLRGGKITTALIGASKSSQILENIGTLKNLTFTEDELNAIDAILK